jgi:hypothetical protein
MKKLPVLFLLSLFILISCNRNESRLQDKWKFIKEVTSGEVTLDDVNSDLGMKDVTYEFYDKNKYSKQGMTIENNLDKLVVSKGEWKLDKLKRDTTEVLQLILREEQINGVFEMQVEIVKLDDNELIWKDKRNNKFYFAKISE